jgi:hypothetical protein
VTLPVNFVRLGLRFVVVVAVLCGSSAFAYPWMVKHNYGSCGACHVDPSGGGQLTSYGRAQSDVLVRWKATKPPVDKEQEVPRSANFLWFLELPDAVNLSGNFRDGVLVRPATTAMPVIPLIMSTDLYATINVDRFVFHAAGGFGFRNEIAKAIVAPQCNPVSTTTGQCGPSFVSREFWAGAKFADEAVMVRAGRLNLPFGLRNYEHTSWVRTLTLTDINVDQQVGVAVSYNSETLRGEVMGILGNFQTGPDAYRERGYSAFAEYAIKPNAYVGLSSLIAASGADPATLAATTRHAHGLFARVAPTESFALLAEADLLAWVSLPTVDRIGFAAWLQGDYEIMQGLHVIGTLEGSSQGNAGETLPSLGGWLSASWYLLPHCELRLDNILRKSPSAATVDYSLLVMFHFFL